MERQRSLQMQRAGIVITCSPSRCDSLLAGERKFKNNTDSKEEKHFPLTLKARPESQSPNLQVFLFFNSSIRFSPHVPTWPWSLQLSYPSQTKEWGRRGNFPKPAPHLSMFVLSAKTWLCGHILLRVGSL